MTRKDSFETVINEFRLNYTLTTMLMRKTANVSVKWLTLVSSMLTLSSRAISPLGLQWQHCSIFNTRMVQRSCPNWACAIHSILPSNQTRSSHLKIFWAQSTKTSTNSQTINSLTAAIKETDRNP